MLTAEGQAKILDFGIAHRQEEQPETELQRPPVMSSPVGEGAGTGVTGTGTALPFPIGGVTGTVDYMSPEQAQGEEPSASSDIYSLGILLQELFTGVSARRGGKLSKGSSRRRAARRSRSAASTPTWRRCSPACSRCRRARVRRPWTRSSGCAGSAPNRAVVSGS